jgi:hypothetical protein
MQDIIELNIPNVCFSLTNDLNKDDKRQETFKQQRLERGFDDTETWNLDYTIASFILPRLKRFKQVANCYPGNMTLEEWEDILDKMIDAFEFKVKEDDESWTLEEEKAVSDRVQEGLDLFAKYYFCLWW